MRKIFNVITDNSGELNKEFLEKVAGRQLYKIAYDVNIIRGYSRNGRLMAIFFIVEK